MKVGGTRVIQVQRARSDRAGLGGVVGSVAGREREFAAPVMYRPDREKGLPIWNF